jgi:hypothetical protein
VVSANLTSGISAPAQEKLDELRLSVNSVSAAAWVWDRIITRAEKIQLGKGLEVKEALEQEPSIARMWSSLHGGTWQRAVVELSYGMDLIGAATRRWLIDEIGEAEETPALAPRQQSLNIAVATHDLVVCESPRSVHWRGSPIGIDWYDRTVLWAYFSTLARAASRGQPIDAGDFGDDRKGDYAVKQKSRLTRLATEDGTLLFPTELGDLIRSPRSKHQILDLAADRICVLDIAKADELHEVGHG